MNELIKIEKSESGKDCISARELHKFLESKQDFSNWIKNRIEKYDFIENMDFATLNKKIERQILIEYFITIDMAKQLSMVENNEKGKMARRYFIECENKLKNTTTITAPTTLKEALLLSLELLEKNEALQLENSKQASQIKRLMHVNKNYTTTEIAKELGMNSAIALNNTLCKMKVQYKQNGTWLLYAKYSGQGYEIIKQDVLDNDKIVYTRRWSQEGRDFILELF